MNKTYNFLVLFMHWIGWNDCNHCSNVDAVTSKLWFM